MKTLILSVFAIFAFTLLFNFKVNGLPANVLREDINSFNYCKTCNALIPFIDKLSQNASDGKPFLQKPLINICNDYSQLPGQQTTQMCSHMIEDLLKMFKNVNRATFCDEISACDRDDINSNNEINTDLGDNVTCDFCTNIVSNIKDIVSGKQTELEIKYLVEDYCHYLGSFENECVSLSDEYLDSLFSFIRQSLQPKKLCQAIGACPRSSQSKQIEKIAEISEIINIFPPEMPLIPLESAKPVKDDMECLLCKRLVKLIIQELGDNRTEQQIIAALDHVCQLFPKKDEIQCNSFVEQYTEEIIHILTEETDPELACTLIGVCLPKTHWQTIKPHIEIESSNGGESREAVKWQEIEPSIEVESSNFDVSIIETKIDSPKKSKVCYECELLMHFLQNEIYDYNNEEQIEQFVENELCDKLTIVITKDACDNFVKQYGPQVLQLIAQQLFDPSTVCAKELKICSNTAENITKSPPSDSDFVINRVTEKCELCVALVQQMDTLLENEQFDKEVGKIVEKTCNTLPKAKQVECELMVEAFAPYFLQMIGHLSNANQICKSIDMCYTTGNVQLLGGHKCSFGPSYWCHTIAHAEACKATHFCKNKVWKAMP